jgi:hypothetical protein
MIENVRLLSMSKKSLVRKLVEINARTTEKTHPNSLFFMIFTLFIDYYGARFRYKASLTQKVTISLPETIIGIFSQY